MNDKKRQQVNDLLKKAEAGAREVLNSQKYSEFLTIMSKFHNYSFRNNLLILMQKPNATYVAGYVAWQKKFNRQVKRGEKGIQIMGYGTYKTTEIENSKEVERIIPYFVPVYVYDISQTEGEPLPKLINELDASVSNYNNIISSLQSISPYKIEFEHIYGGAKGYCDLKNKRIAIKEGMSQAHTIKTIIHEITHADLHSPDLKLTMGNAIDNRTREVEAESTAFVVCSHYGIDTSDYSFGYIATWSKSKELNELNSSFDRIQKHSSDFIDRLDNNLEINQLSVDHKQTKSIKDRIDRAINKAENNEVKKLEKNEMHLEV